MCNGSTAYCLCKHPIRDKDYDEHNYMPATVNIGLMVSVSEHRACQHCTEQAA